MRSRHALATVTTTALVAALLAALGAGPAAVADGTGAQQRSLERCAPVLAAPTPAAEVLADEGSLPAQSAARPALRRVLGRAVLAAARDELARRATSHGSARRAARLWLDRCGQAYYTDPVAPAATGGSSASQGTETQLAPLGDTFSLHSKPGAARTIYLDFDGHTVAGTAWNSGLYAGRSSVALAGFDTDGARATFSDAERIVVQNVWAIVAEDYAPFDVDVTTAPPAAGVLERSGPTDDVYGTRAVVTDDSAGQSSCGCGGVAYVGVFNNTASHEYYQPALIFAGGLGHSAKNIAEAVSHEVGHNLGLVHQGTGSQGYYTGHGVWAPIMGVGYYKPVSQWAHGEYTGANSTQDELAVIPAYGAPVRADDHGDAAATAEVISGSLTQGVTMPGVISAAGDVDAFTFTLTAPATLNVRVDVSAVAPDLDVDLRLVNGAGVQVAADNPSPVATGATVVSGMGASLSALSLNAGTYTLTIDGSGSGTTSTGYSDYGSLGSYVLVLATGPLDAPTVTTTSLPGVTSGVSYSSRLAAVSSRGAPTTWSLDAALPAGLTLSPEGVLSGRTTTIGRTTLRARVSDNGHDYTTVALPLDVATAVKISGLTTTTGQAGSAFTSSARISGGTAPYQVVASGKPDWAAVSSSGVITGTPTRAELSTFVLSVTDAFGRTASATVSATIGGSLRVGTETLPYGGTVVAGASTTIPLTAVGGTKPYTWKPTASTLPTGVTLSSTGTLTVGRTLPSGTSTVTVVVGDAVGASATRTYTLTPLPPLTISAGTATWVVGEQSSISATAAGGTGEVTLSATALPSGWTFTNGVLTGTPSSTTAVSVTLVATDDRVGRTLTKTVSITAKAALAVSTTSLTPALVGKASSTTLRAVGGVGPYTWSLAAGTLPTGWTLTGAGVLAGTSTVPVAGTLRFRVTDSQGRVATSPELLLSVTDPLSVATATLPAAAAGRAYSASVTAAGGTGSYRFSATGLPAGLTISSSGAISGTPTTASTRTVTVKVVDSAGRTATRGLVLVVGS